MAHIFLLEDDTLLCRGISIALQKDHHTVTAVSGYLEALQKYQRQKYDLFLLDINLPDGSGLTLCQKIRETSETPVLFLTANDTEEDMLSGFLAGCDDYVSKPFPLEVLRKKVLAILKRTISGTSRIHYRDLDVDTDKCLVFLKGGRDPSYLYRIQAAHLPDAKQRNGRNKSHASGKAVGCGRKLY